jgi:hypothetical protein
MKKVTCAVTFVTALIACCGLSARADEQSQLDKTSHPADSTMDYAGKFGIGLMIGEPTGLSAKYFLNDTLALDAAAGASLHDNSDFYVHSDLLFHKFDLIPVSRGHLPVYIGGGVFARFRDRPDDQFGVRVPIGVSYMFEQAPVDIFMEIAPGVDLSPSVRADITGGVGVRFWF